jgi:hypothetical protein
MSDPLPVDPAADSALEASPGLEKLRLVLRGLLALAVVAAIVLFFLAAPPAAATVDPQALVVVLAEGPTYGSTQVSVGEGAAPAPDEEGLRAALAQAVPGKSRVVLRIGAGVYQREVERVCKLCQTAAGGSAVEFQFAPLK